MRIKSIHPISSVIVRTTEKPWGEYQRYSADNWQLLMGMSWEEVDGTESVSYTHQTLPTICSV